MRENMVVLVVVIIVVIVAVVGIGLGLGLHDPHHACKFTGLSGGLQPRTVLSMTTIPFRIGLMKELYDSLESLDVDAVYLNIPYF